VRNHGGTEVEPSLRCLDVSPNKACDSGSSIRLKLVQGGQHFLQPSENDTDNKSKLFSSCRYPIGRSRAMRFYHDRSADPPRHTGRSSFPLKGSTHRRSCISPFPFFDDLKNGSFEKYPGEVYLNSGPLQKRWFYRGPFPSTPPGPFQWT
jgi:hypothetical protein